MREVKQKGEEENEAKLKESSATIGNLLSMIIVKVLDLI
jgi:hypothetical protein